MTEEKYKKAKEQGFVRPTTVLFELDCWELVLKEMGTGKKKLSISDAVNNLIRKGGAKD